MKVSKLKKTVEYNKFSKEVETEFDGEVILEVFGEKILIGNISTMGNSHKTIDSLFKRIKPVFLSHIQYFKFDIRDQKLKWILNIKKDKFGINH